jgi:hypothetical protein
VRDARSGASSLTTQTVASPAVLTLAPSPRCVHDTRTPGGDVRGVPRHLLRPCRADHALPGIVRVSQDCARPQTGWWTGRCRPACDNWGSRPRASAGRRHRAVGRRLASIGGAILCRLALDVRWPHIPSAVPPGRHRSRPGGTLCQEGPGRRSPPCAWPAARDVRRRPLVGGHRAGWRVGTEPAPGSVQPQRLAPRRRRREAAR